MKINKVKNEIDEPVSESNEEYYPYGTSLQLEDKMISDLNLSDYKVGDILKVIGVVEVTAVSSHDGGEGEKNDVSLQFTDIDLTKKDTDKSKILYKE